MLHARPRTGTVLVTALIAGMLTFSGAPASAADMDCGDFPSQKAAQIFFLDHGGPSSDPHRLDSEGDGIACESNPAPYYYGTSPSGGSAPQPRATKQSARIIKVTDGDTVKVRLKNGSRKDVRLVGIDTPEVYGGVECGGRAASRSLKRLLPRGTKVVLVSDPTQDRVDRYGRLLRYVVKAARTSTEPRSSAAGPASTSTTATRSSASAATGSRSGVPRTLLVGSGAAAAEDRCDGCVGTAAKARTR
jgi:hypothetical protein